MDELDYVKGVLAEDGKNYHAWSHRQWILSTLNDERLWVDEMKHNVNDLINEDVRNNSAWNERWFVSHRGKKLNVNVNARRSDDRDGSGSRELFVFPLEQARKEIEYAISKAAIDPYNESPWRYFIAIIREQLKLSMILGKEYGTGGDGNVDGNGDGNDDNDDSTFHKFLLECEAKVIQTKKEFEEEYNKDGKECTHLLSAYVDILHMKGDEISCHIAHGLCEELANRYDTVRKKYWDMRANQITSSH